MNNGPARPGEVSAAPGSLENPIPIGPDQIHGEKWKDVAFALHYVDFVKDVHGGDLHAGLHRLPDQDKVPNAFTSMERDLLAYQFQYKMGSQATLASYCLNTKPVPVSIHLPGTIRFNSEGEWKCIQPQSTLLQANARISYTEFPKSNIRVWHVVLTPVGAFTVYDIVSLIHLYDGRSESTDVNKVTFQVNGKGRLLNVGKLLGKLVAATSSEALKWLKSKPKDWPKSKPKCGTVQIIVGNDDLIDWLDQAQRIKKPSYQAKDKTPHTKRRSVRKPKMAS